MIICMSKDGLSDILCVTNRALSSEDFLMRIEKIATAHPAGIILREKDMQEEAYKKLAENVLAICKKQGTCCILHYFYHTAIELNSTALHLPLPLLRKLPAEKKAAFSILGASCHSAEDAIEAEKLGCTYLTLGHIFATDCKKGLPGRGLAFLNEVCRQVSIPVYAIGGIHAGNIAAVRENGAFGACVMSGAMTAADVKGYFSALGAGEKRRKLLESGKRC